MTEAYVPELGQPSRPFLAIYRDAVEIQLPSLTSRADRQLDSVKIEVPQNVDDYLLFQSSILEKMGRVKNSFGQTYNRNFQRTLLWSTNAKQADGYITHGTFRGAGDTKEPITLVERLTLDNPIPEVTAYRGHLDAPGVEAFEATQTNQAACIAT